MSRLTCNTSTIPVRIPIQSLRERYGRVSFVHYNRKSLKNMESLNLSRKFCDGTTRNYELRQMHLITNAIDASFGDMAGDSNVFFPRINIRDPYKRLGISKEASEDEIQAARNFLINEYAGHKPSVDAIESAHDKIIMQHFHERRRPKLNIKKKVKDLTQSRAVQAVTSRFQTPATNYILTTAILFAILGVLTVLFPTEEGPTFQVAISLLATIYFIYGRLKSKLRALLYGVGAFGVSWLLGTFMMVSVIPPILRGQRSLEVTTSLITYLLLWVSSTYLSASVPYMLKASSAYRQTGQGLKEHRNQALHFSSFFRDLKPCLGVQFNALNQAAAAELFTLENNIVSSFPRAL
ncbi:Chaperone-like protein of por1 protein [Thalictrum thalictroides]|uniref:Chaperone-like protein of por1 protein n=1 Tax=Thalictrum thalictroides TaxID=46969 RepID=A0A7J6WP14_THATH|nr:Chaperone-like protein of por1 protein [Thalictrum thalictroides]